ncbi:MAG: alginate O-acetyltransferase complex protein AlgI [Alphaproteobacteria bacterium]|nr:alginate O-acetyltransferase complex protein AlgI [Alphaproteobacteria bacterium]
MKAGSGIFIVVFSSIPFLFYFLPTFFLIYYVTPGIALKNVVLLLASLLFYAWGEPWFVVVLIGQTAFNYTAALVIGAAERKNRTVVTAAGIAVNLLLLGIFKYGDFVVGTLNLALPSDPFALPGLALPLGISFFTFHSISYLIDVHRGQVVANRDPLQVAVYIAMFPQLVAGPIIRYHTISRRLGERRTTLGRASAGVRIFIIGLAQKVLIADEVARIAERIFDHVVAPSFIEAWLGLGAYSVQIYFDFMGYSNMAIGLGLALGFAFPRNFNMPYTSRSVTEFWRRWHMSLSQWLRDYLYIPLGGSRGSALETYRNLWLVFLLCGLWHGANWTFVIWGAHHGLFLVLERAGLARWLERRLVVVSRLYLLFVVMTGWIWFRAHDFDHAATLFGSLIGRHGWGEISFETHLVLYPAALAALVAGAALSLFRIDWMRSLQLFRFSRAAYPAMDTLAVALFFSLSVLSVAAGSYSPFLYFRF